MKAAAISMRWVLGLLLLGGSSAAAVGPTTKLMAQGSPDRLWVARIVEPKTGEQRTTIYLRPKGEPDWRGFTTLGVGIVGAANRGEQLAVILPDGNWMFVSSDGSSTGRPMPGGGRVLTLASDGDTLWAVGLVSPKALTTSAAISQAAASAQDLSQPPTAPSSVATVTTFPATTQSSRQRLMLFQLKGDWSPVDELPDGITSTDPATLSLALLDGVPYVATRQEQRGAVVWAHQGERKWVQLAAVQSPFDVQELKLLSGTPRPVLWTAGTGGAARLWFLGPEGARAVDLSRPATATSDRAVAYANGSIRSVWMERDKLVEQSYDPLSGQPAPPEPRPLPQAQLDPRIHFWLQSVITAALAFAIVASLRHRKQIQKMSMEAQALPLAPLGPRLLAGLIDAFPILIALGFLVVRRWLGRGNLSGQMAEAVIAAGVLIYLLHTMALELWKGRSIGKMCFGIRVVGLDGQRPQPHAVIVRNLLRVIDLAVIPLALVLYSPLRQRAADVAAGTLVVTNEVMKNQEETAELVETNSRGNDS